MKIEIQYLDYNILLLHNKFHLDNFLLIRFLLLIFHFLNDH